VAFRSLLRNHAIAFLRCYSFEAFRTVFAEPMISTMPDIVHCHDSMALLAAHSVARTSGAALIYDSHELEAHRNIFMPSYLQAKIMAIEAQVLSDADGVITVSDCFADDLARMYDITRPIVVHNAPPRLPMSLLPRWQAVSRYGGLREEAGIDDDAVLMVYTGNIGLNRGIEQAVSGLAEYYRTTSKQRDVHFSIVGSATDDTADRVRAQAQAMGLGDKVHFHAPVPPTEVTTFIADADISVVSVMPATRSYDRTMPNKIFEAAIAGLPILGTDLTAQGDFIRVNDIGVTYDPESATSFCAGLLELLSHPARYQRNSEQQKRFDGAFSWEAQGRKLTDLYAQIAAARGCEIRNITMVVPNSCDPDFRVIKEAQTLAAAGYDITLFATCPRGSQLPEMESMGEINIIRRDWTACAVGLAIFDTVFKRIFRSRRRAK
jgi:glycogen(starch) synthase